VNVTTTPTTINCKETVTFDASTSEDVMDFVWTFSGGDPSSSNASVVVVTYNNEGTFPVTLLGSNSCGTDNSFSTNVTVNGPCNVGLGDYFQQSFMLSTTSEVLTLMSKEFVEGKLTLYNAIGQHLISSKLSGQSHTINISGFSSGIYIVQVEHNTGIETWRIFVP